LIDLQPYLDLSRYVPLQSWLQLLALQVACAVLFGIIRLLLDLVRGMYRGGLEFSGIGGAIVSGGTFPVTILLVSHPFSPTIQALFTTQLMETYLAIAGLTLSSLSLYRLCK
jgi:hypothetical protein